MDVAKDLIAGGADVNAQRSSDGFTPLHVAVKNNQPRMTDLLVQEMADLHIQEVHRHLAHKGGLLSFQIGGGRRVTTYFHASITHLVVIITETLPIVHDTYEVFLNSSTIPETRPRIWGHRE